VFIPILLMGGIIGRLFREFAVTLSVAILVSLAVSLATTPMMCALLLGRPEREHHGRFHRASERFFALTLRIYDRSLSWALNHSLFIILILAIILCLNFYLYDRPQGLLPAAGHGPDKWEHPGRPEHIVSADAEEVAAVHCDYPEGSGG
jgi:multidrug efflux pump